MLKIIVSCEDSALYVKIENKNLILVTNPKEATKFKGNMYDHALEKVLRRARSSFDKNFVVASVSDNFFGAKPKYLFEAGDKM